MKKYLTLKAQIILIFSIVSLLTAVIFLAFLEKQTRNLTIEQDRQQQRIFALEVLNKATSAVRPMSEYNGYILISKSGQRYRSNMEIAQKAGYTEQEIVALMSPFPQVNQQGRNNLYFYGTESSDDQFQVITFSDGSYQRAYGQNINFFVRTAFVAIILLGNMIIILWATLLVERINILKAEVSQLNIHQFKKPIEIQGHDEITDLSRAIENMRISIEKNEEIKQEMLQNVSHDIKTPIAVIKSYAEAIYDGISDKEDLMIIIKQADILNKKVRQLLELNKLEYLKNKKEFVDVPLKQIFEQIILQNKFRTEAKMVLIADDSTYYGIYDNFTIAFSNLIDNAIRYARTTIEIKIAKKKITIYNDGEKIDEKFIKDSFKPYEKGSKGQFGLGLSIVYKTLSHFNLKMKVENINNGVMFTIEPLL